MKRKKWAMVALALIYMAFVLKYTVFDRDLRIQIDRGWLFASYQSWLQGNKTEGMLILANIILFMPLGFYAWHVTKGNKHGFLQAIGIGFLCSLLIEVLQLLYARGLFEADDLMDNTLGAVIGYGISAWFDKAVLARVKPKAASVFVALLGIAFACASGYQAMRTQGTDIFNSQRYFCFDVEKASSSNGKYELSGFAFMPYRELSSKDFDLYLKSLDGGKKIKMKTTYGLERKDVDDYFTCGKDDIHSGFYASMDADSLENGKEYEVYVKCGGMLPVPTGVYVTSDDIHLVPLEDVSMPNVEGTDLENIVRNGSLMFCDSSQSSYVYQYGWSLYWLAGKDFPFSKDGDTLIEYHIWTTQVEDLPEERRELNLDFDWISSGFEKYEITDTMNCGGYRVYKRGLPQDYSVLSVFTGCRNEDGLAWSCYFRPDYSCVLQDAIKE